MPASRAISVPLLSRSASRHRLRRDTPTTIIVALTPRAKSTTALGTSSPTTVWNVPPRDSTSRRCSAIVPGATLGSPSVASTCTASRSEPAARWAMRAPRRSSVSPSGPPVTATTTRSRAGHGASMRWSRR